jgi:hypothetical protein
LTPGPIATVCAANLVCNATTATCADLAVAGASCRGVQCRDGLVCETATLTCVAPTAPIGAPCGSSAGCVREAFCSRPTSEPATCQKRAAVGEACVQDESFGSGSCEIGLVCGVDTLACREAPREGEPCESKNGLDQCAGDLHCQPMQYLGSSSDRWWRGDCEPPSPLGTPCYSDNDCESKHCDARPDCRDVCDVECLSPVLLPYCR